MDTVLASVEYQPSQDGAVKSSTMDVAVSQLVSANTSATCVSAGTLLQLAHVGDNWHSNSGTPIASGGTVENEGNSSIEGAATGRELVEGSSRGGSVENSASGVVTGSSSVTDGTPVIEGESEVTNATNSMHTEEEDVATFLATQLASQAAPPQTTAEYVSRLRGHEVVTPLRVDRDGRFLGHHLDSAHDPRPSAHARSRRAAHIRSDQDEEVHYVIALDGEEHQVTLRPNARFLAPHAVVERRRGRGPSSFPGGVRAAPEGDPDFAASSLRIIGREPSCHYHGFVRNHTDSRVALSACSGLTGYLRTDKDEYLIEPVRNHARTAHEPHPHLVYKRSALPSHAHEHHSCATEESYERALNDRETWEESQEDEKKKRRRRRRRRRRKRSVSVERNVEVTVVADKKMVDYYSNEDINTYILTVMNMVSSVYHDASLGNAVNMYVVRIMLLEDPQYEEELDISHNADDTLRSFCQWQQMINPGNETHPYHHDVAVLITRYNICSRMTDRCSTLGVAEIAGMCQPLRSCNVNEDTGLQIAYTIAHELGHNFGMNHDGPQNGCQAQYGVSQHVMSPHLTSEPIPVTWSNCSRKEITHFLDRDWGACLEDEPPQVEYSFPELPPGAMYDADHQCRLSFGAGATHCEGIEGTERICQTLWCHLDNRCITRMEPAAEGTHCGKHKWCVMGRCVTMGERPAAINGEWGSWSSWSQCTRTCGAGTQMAERHCDNPAPANGGRYCTGDRKRYRICNTEDCPENGVSFRAKQCSKYDSVPYKGANHTWQPVMQHHTPCELQCKPDNEFYSVKLAEVVADGTPCKLGTRDMCINGMCKRVACDWTIEGSAQMDRCGLCHGDGTQCTTYRGLFNTTRGIGYIHAATFPVHARNVKIRDVDDAANYLALRNNLTGEYFLNGNWMIKWSGEYYYEGTMVYYNREGETEELFLPGPLKIPLTLLLLFQTENPGVEWEYTLPRENATYIPSFAWEHSDWSVCTVTCGGGKQVSRVQCMEKEAGLVEDRYCQDQPRPEDRSRECNIHACPAWWWSGRWQPCSITCGNDRGTRRRTVICVRSFGPTEQMALMDSDCDLGDKPHETEVCPELPPCPKMVDWSVGPWSQSCSLDPCEFEQREVVCVAPEGKCDPLTRPAERRQCGNITCGHWDVGDWSKCSADCGEGVQFRRVTCLGGLACREKDEPKSVRECEGDCLEPEEETLPEYEYEGTMPEEDLVAETLPDYETTLPEYTLPEYTEVEPVTLPEYEDKGNMGDVEMEKTKEKKMIKEEGKVKVSEEGENKEKEDAEQRDTEEGKYDKDETLEYEEEEAVQEYEDDMTLLEYEEELVPKTLPEYTQHVPTDPPSTVPSTTTTAATAPTETTTTAATVAPSTTYTTPSSTAATILETTETLPDDPTTSAHNTERTMTTDLTSTSAPEATLGSTAVPTTPSITTMETSTATTMTDSSMSTFGDEVDTATTPGSHTPTNQPDPVEGKRAEDIGAEGSSTDGPELSKDTLATPETSEILEDSVMKSDPSQEPLINEIDTDSKPSRSEAENDSSKAQQKPSSSPTEEELDDQAESPGKTVLQKTKKFDRVPVPSEEQEDAEDEATGIKDTTDLEAATLGEEAIIAEEPSLIEEPTGVEKSTWIEEPTVLDFEQEDEVGETGVEEKKEETIEKEDDEEEDGVKVEAENDEEEEKIKPEVENDNVDDESTNKGDEEKRPEGIAVDKIDPSDFEVIEIVEVPSKGKKKKDRKKVLIHSGEEAVDVLHKLAEEQMSKHTTSTTTTPRPPYYQWHAGNWSECSVQCGGGVSTRTVQCRDQVTATLADPRLCDLFPPVDLKSCNVMECAEWEVGEWGECEGECDLGERQREVSCPPGRRCSPDARPPEAEPCELSPCVSWVEGPWSLCTKSCGGGYQIRLVKCVDMRTQEKVRTCNRDSKPKQKLACNKHRCPKNRRGQQKRCRDRLDTKLCKRLKNMCTTKFFAIKCCRTSYESNILSRNLQNKDIVSQRM
ncbi:A disintegrin and metalloproteinase with thrombospondin motifs 7-like [Penaeus japonicus]|uniref:A disintegrin and metalloproteinase with thrombospondin motifs 7-like n=1 Tax=Penaeus japonicus TaxID=27405 RepID=UPI001C70D5F4|nr:A disintegrin and metalloproteinase with thrombospondin motifs 7-like [Penaeus japonicus]